MYYYLSLRDECLFWLEIVKLDCSHLFANGELIGLDALEGKI